MPVPVQAGPFQPVTAYDAPQVLFTQLLDGELGFDSVGRTLFHPDELTPSERDTIAGRMAKAAGDSKIVKAMADVALNPWTWFFFLTAPSGGARAASLFKLNKGFSPYVTEEAPLLSHIGLLTSLQAVRGTRIGEAVAQHARGVEEVLQGKAVQEAALRIGQVQDSLGLTHGFDPRRYTVGTKEWTAAKEIRSALWVADEQAMMKVWRFEPVYASKKAVKKGIPELRIIEREALTPGADPVAILQKYGAGDLVDLLKKSREEVASKVYKDPASVVKIWEASERMGNGREMMRSLMGDAHSAIRKGNITQQEFEDALQKLVIDPVRTQGASYSPRNVSDVFLNGKMVKDEAVDAVWSAAMRSSGTSVPRGTRAAVYHPDDLQDVADVFGSSPALDKEIRRGKAMLQKSIDKKVAVRLLRIDPELSASRYWKTNATTYATFVQDIGEGVRRADREIARELGSEMRPQVPSKSVKGVQHRRPLDQKSGAPIEMSLSEAEKLGMAPAGGFSLADVVYADSVVTSNPWTRETINRIVAPRMMGRVTDERAFIEASVLSSKQMAARFLSTDAAKAIEKSGAFGEGFIKKLQTFSNPETAFETARDWERGAVKTLYSAGLAGNVPTAIINATQPFMLAGNVTGYDNLMKAYGKAFQEMGEYVSLRASQGWKALTTAERADALRKTHSMMNFDGEDLLEMAGGTLANLEGQVLRSIVGEHTKSGLADRIFFELPMTLFRNTELLNRNVTAHAAHFRDLAQQAKGVAMPVSTMKDNIRGLVRETQFGSHWMNMPQSFLPEAPQMGIPWGRWFANPLIRQYMTYPARTLGAWAHTVPRMAGRSPTEAWRGLLNDGVRAMAVSAIGVEAAKNLLGADLSKAGFIAGVTDMIPGFQGGRFDGREGPIPVPPVLDSAYNILKSGFTGDLELFQRTLPRVVPMGAAISRALKAAPDAPILGALGQTQYADWANTQNGMVPVYKDDGTLVEMRNPADLIMRGLGVDMGGFQDESKFMGFLVKQRDQATATRREYLSKLVGGDWSGAEKVAREYERRWKVPLTVTKAQTRQFMDNRERPRVARQLEGIAEDLRPQYEAMRGPTLGPDLRSKVSYPVFGDGNSTRLSPEVIQMIQQEVARRSVPDQRNPAASTPTPWGPFNLPDVE